MDHTWNNTATAPNPTAPNPSPQTALLRQSLESERQELEKQKAAFAAQQRLDAVSRELRRRGIPEDFAPFLAAPDETQVLDNVDQFERIFRKAIADAIAQRFHQIAPPRDPSRFQIPSIQAIRHMSPKEINARWDEISQLLSR